MSFSEITGQKRVCQVLEKLLATTKNIPLLFVGQPGVGKRTVALKLAQAVNCEKGTGKACGRCPVCTNIARLNHPDVRLVMPVRKPSKSRDTEIPEKPAEEANKPVKGVIEEIIKHYPDYTLDKPQPPSIPNLQIPIDAIRWLGTEMAKPPVSARMRFFIILSAHQLNEQAQSALLKILEEPQANTLFILTATNSNALIPTIRSRCHIIRFADIPENLIAQYLTKQGITQRDAKTGLQLAAVLGQGSIGKALSALNNPDEFFFPPVIEYLKKGRGDDTLFTIFDEIAETSLTTVVNTALFFYENTLRAHLGYNYLPQFTSETAINYPLPLLRKKLAYIYDRFHECQLNTNRNLSLYTFLSVAT
ncbi:MAG: hypothetical protein ABIK47_02350 [candidate division WOR-3 bacterium]